MLFTPYFILHLALLPLSLCMEAQIPLIPKNPLPQPSIGFGTWNLGISPENTTAAVSLAIEAGYRQIDCAAAYGNEKDVGWGIREGLKKAGLRREGIWVTSKLWNDHHGDYETVESALNKTLKDLGLDYLDLYLMHWPVSSSSKSKKKEIEFVETWRSMSLLPKSLALNIGISNFSPSQLSTLLSSSRVKPFVHQMELHPYLPQTSWLATHDILGISVTAYSPLGNSNPTYDHGNKSLPPLLKNEVLRKISERRGCTTAQVALAWGVVRGTKVIPKSSHEKWIRENIGANDCELEGEDIYELGKLGKQFGKRLNNPSEEWGVKLFEGLDGV